MEKALRTNILKTIIAQSVEQNLSEASGFDISSKYPAVMNAYGMKGTAVNDLFSKLHQALHKLTKGKLNLEMLIQTGIDNIKFQQDKAVNLVQDCVRKFFDIFIKNIEPKPFKPEEIKNKATQARNYIISNTLFESLMPSNLKSLKTDLENAISKI